MQQNDDDERTWADTVIPAQWWLQLKAHSPGRRTAFRMQRLLTDYQPRLGDLRKGSRTWKIFQSKYAALRGQPAPGSFLINDPEPIQELLVFPLSCTQTTAALKDPCPEGRFSGFSWRKACWALVRPRKGMYLLRAGALPKRTQWAWIQWHLLTQSVWVARPSLGFSDGHRMLAMRF